MKLSVKPCPYDVRQGERAGGFSHVKPQSVSDTIVRTIMDAEKITAKRWDIKRGLNRLFVVFAVCWYIGSVVFLGPQWIAAIKAERNVIVAQQPNPDSFMEQQRAIEAARALRPVKATFLCWLTPPSLYGFIFGIFWVVRGFRRDAKSE